MKPDYGIDAPGAVLSLLLIGVACLLIAWFAPAAHFGGIVFRLRPMGLLTGLACTLEALLMILYAKFGKFHHRDRMLALVNWKGNETVLDVGTGRGLLMIGAAGRLSLGRAIGIDIWSAKDLSGNRLENTLRNADMEGVRDRVEVRNGDATAMDFPDQTFDVVLSNLCLHNIPGAGARARACQEIMRVLKRGGVAVISDFKNTADYAKTFQDEGASVVRGPMQIFDTFPPLRIVAARKPK